MLQLVFVIIFVQELYQIQLVQFDEQTKSLTKCTMK